MFLKASTAGRQWLDSTCSLTNPPEPLQGKHCLGENPNAFSQNISTNLRIAEIEIFEIVGKAGTEKKPTIRLINSWKSWIWDQFLPENMKWKCGNTGRIYFQEHEMDYFWNFETLKLWKQETKKPRNVETKKLWNFKTEKPRN